MTQEEKNYLAANATQYEPPIEQTKADYDRLVASGKKPEAKICDINGTMVGYVLGDTAYIGSWNYYVHGIIFNDWLELNNLKLVRD